LPFVNSYRKKQKKKRNVPEELERNIRQKKRNSGQEYVKTMGHIEKKNPSEQFCVNYIHKSTELLSKEARSILYAEFWKLDDINKQHDYI
jgi:hypothetical protein